MDDKWISRRREESGNLELLLVLRVWPDLVDRERESDKVEESGYPAIQGGLLVTSLDVGLPFRPAPGLTKSDRHKSWQYSEHKLTSPVRECPPPKPGCQDRRRVLWVPAVTYPRRTTRNSIWRGWGHIRSSLGSAMIRSEKSDCPELWSHVTCCYSTTVTERLIILQSLTV